MTESDPSTSKKGELNVMLSEIPTIEDQKACVCEAVPGNSATSISEEIDKIISKDNSEQETEGNESPDIEDDVQEVSPRGPDRRLLLREVASRVAASVSAARAAARACQSMSESTNAAVNVGNILICRALEKSEEAAAASEESVLYARVARKLERAIVKTSERAIQARASAIEAEVAANVADEAAVILLYLGNESPNIDEYIRTADRAASNARTQAVIALKAVYAALVAIVDCWTGPDECFNDLPRRTSAYGAFWESCVENVKWIAACVLVGGTSAFAQTFVTESEPALPMMVLIAGMSWIASRFVLKIDNKVERRLATRAVGETLEVLEDFFVQENAHNE